MFCYLHIDNIATPTGTKEPISNDDDSNNTGVIIGVVFGILIIGSIIVVAIVLGVYYYRKKHGRHSTQSTNGTTRRPTSLPCNSNTNTPLLDLTSTAGTTTTTTPYGSQFGVNQQVNNGPTVDDVQEHDIDTADSPAIDV